MKVLSVRNSVRLDLTSLPGHNHRQDIPPNFPFSKGTGNKGTKYVDMAQA